MKRRTTKVNQSSDDRSWLRPGAPKNRQQRFISHVLTEVTEAGGATLRAHQRLACYAVDTLLLASVACRLRLLGTRLDWLATDHWEADTRIPTSCSAARTRLEENS